MYLKRIENQQDALEKVLHYKRTKLQRIIEDFMMSGDVIAELEIDIGEYKNVHSAQGAISNRIRRMGLNRCLKTMTREDRIYLIHTKRLLAMNETEDGTK